MGKIQLVIEVDERYYEIIKNDVEHGMDYLPFVLIANGTPLPKGHGDLKDANVMINKLCTHEASELFGSVTCAEIIDFISDEKPIIEADKESEECNFTVEKSED